MEINPCPDMTIIVLCPVNRPDAHCLDCPDTKYFIPPQPGDPGDWFGRVTHLDEVRRHFPSVRFHHCLAHALLYGIEKANAVYGGDDAWAP